MNLQIGLTDKLQDAQLNSNLFVFLLAKSGNPIQKNFKKHVLPRFFLF